MKRTLTLAALFALLVTACAAPATTENALPVVTVYESPTWGCCSDWITYLEDNGFTVDKEDTNNLVPVKERYGIPAQLQSCHTAIVDGYVIEGHVPIEDINRLLAERPAVTGLAVPGMPVGSPGMEVAGFDDEPFDVVTFDRNGVTGVFSSYR